MGSTMKTEEIAGLVRALVAALGGYLVGQGLLDSESAMTIGGAVTTIAMAVWSIMSKRKVE